MEEPCRLTPITTIKFNQLITTKTHSNYNKRSLCLICFIFFFALINRINFVCQLVRNFHFQWYSRAHSLHKCRCRRHHSRRRHHHYRENLFIHFQISANNSNNFKQIGTEQPYKQWKFADYHTFPVDLHPDLEMGFNKWISVFITTTTTKKIWQNQKEAKKRSNCYGCVCCYSGISVFVIFWLLVCYSFDRRFVIVVVICCCRYFYFTFFSWCDILYVFWYVFFLSLHNQHLLYGACLSVCM